MVKFEFVAVAHKSEVSLSVVPAVLFPEDGEPGTFLIKQIELEKGKMWDCELKLGKDAVKFMVFGPSEPTFATGQVLDVLFALAKKDAAGLKDWAAEIVEIIYFVIDGVKIRP